MKLSGHTRPYAVLGHPIGHTLSPVMHNRSIQSLGLDAIYLALDVAPDALMDVLPAMKAMGFGGVNLTVPLKEVAFRGFETLDPSAESLGAVNTVEFTDDGMVGHNTDGEGFLLALKEAFGSSPRDRRVFVLGAGGAGRALAITCAMAGAKEIIITDLDADRPMKVIEEVQNLSPTTHMRSVPPSRDSWNMVCSEADLVLQCTPVGMKPDDEPLLQASAFRPGQEVFDLVYMYPETGIMKVARECGASVTNGLGMLLHQGAKAFRIWTGQEPDVQAMRSALETEVYDGDA